MIWRLIMTVGAISFFNTGFKLFSAPCNISFGHQGSARYGTFIASCATTGEGMSPGVAAVLTILGGLVLLAIAWGPVIVRAINDIPPKP